MSEHKMSLTFQVSCSTAHTFILTAHKGTPHVDTPYYIFQMTHLFLVI